jgi:hypothetical protein
MTSSAAAAAQLVKALSPSEQQLSELKEYADFCGIPAIVCNRLTRLDLKLTLMFTRTKKVLRGFLRTIYALESLTDKQHVLYHELMVFFNTIDLYESCKEDPAKMLKWVRGFSALWIVSQAMSENGIKSGVFGGNEGFFHFGRPAWSGESNKYGNVLSSMNLLIKKMAFWAGVESGKNDEVEDLLFEARLANLREDPLKLTGIERLVQAFADEAARNFLAKLPAAGTKLCPGA